MVREGGSKHRATSHCLKGWAIAAAVNYQIHSPALVLKCTSMQPSQERLPKLNEAVLDEADGLNWKTLCPCDLLFTVEKPSLTNKRGQVTQERRREIARKIIQGLAIAGL